jgi:hypothetical protein
MMVRGTETAATFSHAHLALRLLAGLWPAGIHLDLAGMIIPRAIQVGIDDQERRPCSRRSHSRENAGPKSDDQGRVDGLELRGAATWYACV